MPGLCGYVPLSKPGAEALSRDRMRAATSTMLSRLRRFEWQVERPLIGPGAAFGQVAVSTPAGHAPDGRHTAGSCALVLDGEIYAPFEPAAGKTPAAELFQRLVDQGRQAVDGLHGSFAVVWWDEATAQLSIAVDRFGTRPVYWTRTADALVFASEPGALLAVPGVSADRDEEGLAQFLCFGQYLGDSTLYTSIKVAPAGSWLTFDARSGVASVTRFAVPAPLTGIATDAEWKARVADAAVDAVRAACTGGGRLGLSLSGGLDARTILGLAPEGTRLTCVSLGIPGSIDHRAASALARAVGQPHHELMLDDDFLGRFEPLLRRMVDLTDGQYLDQGIVLTTLSTYRELGIETLLRGHAGELMHMSKAYAFSMDREGLALRTAGELDDWLWRHMSAYMIGGADESLFSGSFGRRVRDMARAALERQTARYADVEPVPQRIWRLFVSERLRRETSLSLQLFRNYVEVRVPFLAQALVDLLLAAPPALKVGDDLQSFMLKRHRPAFLHVVNANTGAPMGAGPLRQKISHLKLRVYAKLGVQGYQPYERLGLWLAEDLQPLLTQMLIADAPSGAPFESAEVARLIEQHRTRERNHTFLLMALLTMAFESSSSHARGVDRLVGARG